jgi:integrase
MIATMRRNTTRNTTGARPPRSGNGARRPAPPKLARGQGSTFYDERDGRCVLEHRVQVDGKTRVYRERGDSWPEVEELRDARRAELGRRSKLAGDGSTTLVEAYRDWLEYDAPASTRDGAPVAPGTMRNHRGTLELLEAYPIGETPLLALKVRELEAWYLELSRRPVDSHGQTSLRDIRARLVRVVDRAVRLELVEANVVPSSKIPATARRRAKPRWIDDREAFAAMRYWLAREDASTYDRVLLVTLLTGARPGEVLGLRWDAVDLEARVLLVRSGLQVDETGRKRAVVDELKTEASRRPLEMTADVVASLRAERAEQAARRLCAEEYDDVSLVFASVRGRPLNPSNVRRAARAACEAVGIAYVTPNQYRHTFASVALDLGLSMPAVARAMGHTDTRMVAATYGHSMDEVVPTGTALDALTS